MPYYLIILKIKFTYYSNLDIWVDILKWVKVGLSITIFLFIVGILLYNMRRRIFFPRLSNLQMDMTIGVVIDDASPFRGHGHHSIQYCS